MLPSAAATAVDDVDHGSNGQRGGLFIAVVAVGIHCDSFDDTLVVHSAYTSHMGTPPFFTR